MRIASAAENHLLVPAVTPTTTTSCVAPILASREACKDSLQPNGCKLFVLLNSLRRRSYKCYFLLFIYFVLLATKVSNT